MAKGSQLSQLKSALNSAGVTGQPQQSKKRKRSTPLDQDKGKKEAKLKQIHEKLNPFDVKVTKMKHEVGGRKIKGIVGRPAQSKQAGLEQRKRTLLKEYEDKDRSGGIVDRRFGENDPTMSLDERMLERFTKERQRSSRGAAFNLDDEDDLTHYGQSLSKMDDFDDAGIGLDDEDDDPMDRDAVGRGHFGGFSDEEDGEDGQPERKKSKAEVMAEVMAKSKEHKMLRQMEREKGEVMRQELDTDFDAIRSLLYTEPEPRSASNAVPLIGDRHGFSTATPAATDAAATEVDYDQQVRQLAFEKRAKPKDRTKTEEEVALEEKEALEKAERRRQRRMIGEPEDSDNEEQPKGRAAKRKRGADDLEDDFQDGDEPEWDGIGAGLAGESASVGVDGEEDEDSEEESGDEEEDEGSDESGDDDGENDGESEAEEGEQEALVALPKQNKGKGKARSTVKELPFTFPCPETHEEFLEILEEIEDKDVGTVISRIRALYHTSLAAENKFKLQTLATVFIDHVLFVTSPPTPRFALLSTIIPHIFAITQAYPVRSGEYFNEKISLMHKNLKRGLAKGAVDPEAKTWPGVSELALLRTIGAVWSTSDLNHAVISPTRVLLGAYLGLCRVRSLTDIASGLFICTLFFQFEELSKRLVPEGVNFAINAVLHIAPHSFKDVASLPGTFPSPDFKSELCEPLAIAGKKARKATVQKPDLVAILTGQQDDEQSKVDLLALSLDLLSRYAEMYKGLEGFIELFTPIHAVLEKVEAKKLAPGHQTRLTSLIDALTRLLKFAKEARQPLLLQAHKPIAIPSYIPKFETTTSNYLRRQDPDHEKNEASKLRNQYKQERKGAIRELRKDSRFLAGVEQEKQKAKDQAYKEGMKKVYGSLEGERAEEKEMERESARDKRRAGRKK